VPPLLAQKIAETMLDCVAPTELHSKSASKL